MSIVFVLGLSIIFLNNIQAMEPDKNESHSLIIQDIEKLKPYYKAIQQIRKTLEESANKFNYKTGFKTMPTPNYYHSRTPKYIFLETSIGAEKEKLETLYTPFGEVTLLNGGLSAEIEEISESFLKKMKWKLKDVTGEVSVYNYSQVKNEFFGPLAFKKEPWTGSGYTSKLYLVVSVDSTEFYKKNAKEKLIVLGGIILSEECDYKDRKLFNELSDGKDQF